MEASLDKLNVYTGIINPSFHHVLTRFDISCTCTANQVVQLAHQETNISNSNKCKIICADISGNFFLAY